MKNSVFIFFLLGINLLSAQTETLIQLIFEDAIGQRDTTIIGVSPLACDSSLNADLGEKEVNANFPENISFKIVGTKVKQDSTADTHTFKDIFSKKIFFNYAQNFDVFKRCGSGHKMAVFKCRIVNFPLKIKWNWLVSNSERLYAPKFTPQTNTFSNMNGGTISAYLPSSIPLFNKDSIIFRKEEMTKWSNLPNDYLLFFSLQQIIVGTKDLKNIKLRQLQVFPNPGINTIQLGNEELFDDCLIQFYDATGAFIQAQNLQNRDIDIANLPKGLIIGLVTKEGLPTATFRFLKVE